jgi:hypothetical protein
MKREEILDRIVELYSREDLMSLHSEYQDWDYSSMHPDETVEEFLDHED